jgi:paraquat-inducible protein B
MSLSVTKRKKSIIVLAWIAPIVAIIISFTMVYEHYTKIGNDIELNFKNIDGLDLRQSHIQFNGLHIGDIDSMKLDTKNINNFIVKATIYSEYNYLIKKGSIFYKVSPQLSLDGVSALSNILKGNYIELLPATTNLKKLKILQKQYTFQGYDSKPKTNGAMFSITSHDGSFGISSAILFKGLQIGEVIKKSIANLTINYQILIYEQYKYLISSTTQFYQINPFELNASLENINIKIPSIKNMLSSAIGFITPSSDENIKDSYQLHSSKDSINDADAKYFKFKIKANGISKTDFVIYKGVIVGQIDTVKLGTNTNTVYGKIYSKYKYLINNSTYFYKPKALKTQLSTEGIKVEIPALKELLLGGLSFNTPNQKRKRTYKTFTFYEDVDVLSQNETFIITLKVKDNYNIKTTSKLYYKNIVIAQVNKISLDKDIIIKIKAEKKYQYLFGKNSKIYLKGTQISLEGIENLASTVLGDNLYLIADKNNKLKTKFTLDSINPDSTHYKKGLRVRLKAKDSKNITVGSPIYYKGFEVGEIYDADLVNDGAFIVFNLFIKEKYKNILKQNSRFYKATIVDMDVGVFGANIKMGSVKSMLKGGIYFNNPTSTKKVKNALNNNVFNLLKEKK